jgi:hypothetical protein
VTSLIAHLNGLRRGLSCATSCEALLAVAQVRFKEPRPGAVRRRTASMDRDYLGVPPERTRWRSNALLGVDGPEGLHGSPSSAAGDTGLYLTLLKAGRFRVEWGDRRDRQPAPKISVPWRDAVRSPQWRLAHCSCSSSHPRPLPTPRSPDKREGGRRRRLTGRGNSHTRAIAVRLSSVVLACLAIALADLV